MSLDLSVVVSGFFDVFGLAAVVTVLVLSVLLISIGVTAFIKILAVVGRINFVVFCFVAVTFCVIVVVF